MNKHPLSTNLVLVGFMGSGKSSVGRLLATYLGFRFVDTDAMVVKKAGQPISEIFAQRGEAAFREEETAALRSLVGKQLLVVATGGGIVEREENHPLLHEVGFVVALSATEEVIFERVSRNNKRPLLQTPNPRATISQLLAKRAPLYEAVAEWHIDSTTKTHAEVANEIIAEARRRTADGAEC
ncbi:MAG TPA: shikimate kinase [Chthoniobacteraceae bacterium]|nr:shikimate kinase [Chthoniobacteraceae bacterium]